LTKIWTKLCDLPFLGHPVYTFPIGELGLGEMGQNQTVHPRAKVTIDSL